MKNKNASGNWIFLCNPDNYLINEAFNEIDEIYWHQSKQVNGILVGATVYIYVSGNEKLIKYKCEVIEKDVVSPEENDTEYYLNKSKIDELGKQKRYLLLKLVSKTNNKNLNVEFLRQNGVTCFMGPISLTRELDAKIQTEF